MVETEGRLEVVVMPLTTEFMQKLINASPEKMERIEGLLDGRMDFPKSVDVDISTISFAEASRQSKISCPTLYRLANEGRIPTVKLTGSRRILHRGLVDFMYSGYRGLKGKKQVTIPTMV